MVMIGSLLMPVMLDQSGQPRNMMKTGRSHSENQGIKGRLPETRNSSSRGYVHRSPHETDDSGHSKARNAPVSLDVSGVERNVTTAEICSMLRDVRERA